MQWQPVEREASAGAGPAERTGLHSPSESIAPLDTAECLSSRSLASLEDWGGDPSRDAWATAPVGEASARPAESGETAAEGTSATDAATEDATATRAEKHRSEPAEAAPATEAATEEGQSRRGAAETAPAAVGLTLGSASCLPFPSPSPKLHTLHPSPCKNPAGQLRQPPALATRKPATSKPKRRSDSFFKSTFV